MYLFQNALREALVIRAIMYLCLMYRQRRHRTSLSGKVLSGEFTKVHRERNPTISGRVFVRCILFYVKYIVREGMLLLWMCMQ